MTGFYNNAERLHFTYIISFSFNKGSFIAELKLEFLQNGMNCFEVFIEGQDLNMKFIVV